MLAPRQRAGIIASTAGIAQLVEQLLRKQLVGGSSPLSGTNFWWGSPGLNHIRVLFLHRWRCFRLMPRLG